MSVVLANLYYFFIHNHICCYIIWQSDLKLKKFLHIIENSPVFPVIYDRNRYYFSEIVSYVIDDIDLYLLCPRLTLLCIFMSSHNQMLSFQKCLCLFLCLQILLLLF